ncbi:hypothetical protein D3C80_1719090 [compost metagenome]
MQHITEHGVSFMPVPVLQGDRSNQLLPASWIDAGMQRTRIVCIDHPVHQFVQHSLLGAGSAAQHNMRLDLRVREKDHQPVAFSGQHRPQFNCCSLLGNK